MLKRKEVSWHAEEKNPTSNSKKLKDTSSSKTISDKIEKVLNKLNSCLEHDLTALLLFTLEQIKQKKQLYFLLKYSNFQLFKLALEKQNLRFINYLFQNLAPKESFIMLHHENYAAIKAFFNNAKNSDRDNHFHLVIVRMIKAILSIQPNWEVFEIFESCLSNDTSPSKKETVENLKLILSLDKPSNSGNKDSESLLFHLPQLSEQSEQSKEENISNSNTL